MNGKKKTLILIALFIVLIAGASILYNNLSADYKMDSLVAENTSEATTNESDTTNNDANSKPNESNTTDDEVNSDTNADQNFPQNEDSAKDSSSEENQLVTAPNFTAYDIDGNSINLTDFFGKPIIVNFWASWCGPCKMEMPDFNEAYTTYKDEINFLMINMTDGSRETVEKASSFITESGYIFPVYYDTDYSAAITYSVSSLPTTYFINVKGELVAHARGAIDADTLQKGIDMIYNNNQ